MDRITQICPRNEQRSQEPLACLTGTKTGKKIESQ
jgi:hypothetical protein